MTDVLPATQELSVSTYPVLCPRDLSEKPLNSSSPREVSPLSRSLPLSGGLAPMIMPMTDESSLLPITSVLDFNSST
jgi:hypothetical protein